jgi:hydroxyacylglutathione hydrolase
LQTALKKAASIGYEGNIKGTILYDETGGDKLASFDKGTFSPDQDKYTYLDVRTEKEAKNQPVFKNSVNIPLQELDKRFSEIPTSKPVLIHCGSGYRSATAASMIKKQLPNVQVYDMGAAITDFMKAHPAK